MKIRNGHVSNSSSSSFVVAFPEKPKSWEDVLKFMFFGKEGGVGIDYCDEGMSYRQVAKRVFDDISLENAKEASLADIVEEFSGRYWYEPNVFSRVFHLGGQIDEQGGSWPENRDRYYLFDNKLMEELKRKSIEFAMEEKELHEEEHKIEERFRRTVMKRPSFAYEGGTNPMTKKPYTKEEIKAHKEYEKKHQQFCESDKQYLEHQKKQSDFWDRKHDALDALAKKIAAVDASNFMKDNKGAFVFLVSYGDESGEGVMEHGKIFRNVPHVRISHH